MEPIMDVRPDRPRGRRTVAAAGILLLVAAGGLWAYLRRPSPAGHAESHASPASSAPGNTPTIRITPERQQQIGVRFAEAALAAAEIEIRAVAKVTYDETQIAHVHTKISGWIEDVFVDFVGAPVKKGQALFTIYSPELVSSQEEYLLALRARDELAGSSFARVSQGSRTLLDSARRRLELWDFSEAQIEALAKEGKVSRTVTVASHVSGVVLERAAYHHGKTVTPEMDLYTIVDLSRVWVQASVYEYEAPFIKVGQAAEITLPYDPEAKSLHGRVTFISPFVDPVTRTIQVRTEFPNPDLSLRPDSFVNVSLKCHLGRRLVVTKDAVLEAGASQYVFVDRGDGSLEARTVKAGPEVAAGRVIGEGLQAGERVVTAANFILDSESRLKGAIDAMGRPVPTALAAASASRVTAEVTTSPSPAKIGRNRVRVVIKDAAGQPLADADVDIRLFMPQMTGMAQVDVRAPLRAESGGVYSGDVEIPIAWSFATTVTVRKGGQVVGIAETTITSR